MRINTLSDLPERYQAQAASKIAGTKNTAAAPDAPELSLTPAPDKVARRKNKHLESAEQIALFNRLRRCCDPVTKAALPQFPGADLIFALTNENAEGDAVRKIRYLMGVTPGLPDIGVFAPRDFRGSAAHGLFIEMKREDGVASDVRPAQRAVQGALAAAGYDVRVCYGARRAWAVIADYLGWESAK